MAKHLTKKQNRIAVSIWVLIAAIMILSNNVVQFLGLFGIESASANIMIVFFVILLAFYHEKIAIELSGLI